jgi:Alw26I/Eco31I/Esp3I family type II restriction endonuclease
MARKPDYGRGAPEFLEYVQFIASHPNYAEMPDLHTDTGDIQWEAPSNRSGGKFKDTHNKRRDWWRRKARELGIDPESPHWISKTAKTLHPTKSKPCKACGRILEVRYSYPNGHLLGRLRRLPYWDDAFELDPLEHVTALVERLVTHYGNRVFADLPRLLKATGVLIPVLPPVLEEWIQWIEKTYIPSEPPILSPGAMSNAPDRLDGFHSFNLCCRQTTDPGRSKTNLSSYTTDRRVFEYWVDGDWIAADRLMGQLRSVADLRKEQCRNDHPGPCSADHIGPISLGFAHRPEFQLLCKRCNSAKNNRMYSTDVARLIGTERQGEKVATWYCQEAWNSLKSLVNSEETALRLCKILRDNRHTAMLLLNRIASEKNYTFLTSYLGLEHAECDPTFVNLRIENHFTRFDRLIPGERLTKYAVEQKARRVRIAFVALAEYALKKRNALQISSPDIERSIQEALRHLARVRPEMAGLDEEISVLVHQAEVPEERIRDLVQRLPNTGDIPDFVAAREHLQRAMDQVGSILRSRWEDDRYVREEIDLAE